MFIQPCDWIEQDINYKYVVDVYGRTENGDIARLRITDFKPYFYIQALKTETASQLSSMINAIKQIRGLEIYEEQKLDAMGGFNNLETIRVWKLVFPNLWSFKFISKELKNRIKFESNLPPYLRLFHEKDINPASPIKFEETNDVNEGERVDVCYKTSYKNILPAEVNIPMVAMAYDIETYSSTGNFPVATILEDEIIQIGMAVRWTDNLLESVERYVLVSGTCEPSDDPAVKFISCENERDLLLKFAQYIEIENPDIIAGYNTFGFDDAYIAERCRIHRLTLNLGRSDCKQWGDRIEYVKTEKKTFELASGKYAVRYFNLPGRLPVDLLLSVRREQNLDSYKLDNVASTFLRDKVTDLIIITGAKDYQYEIKTKSTRGLFVGNMVRFDIVTNTINPYREGEKFIVTEVKPKSFIVSSSVPILDHLSREELSKLEWSFGKDDISAQEMFANHLKGPKERSVIAKYCIQDCDLVLTLMAKLDTLVNARGMADVCKVPINFIFLRGQGIKIYSAIAYNACKRGQIIIEQESVEGDMSYEGAVVLSPKIGMYLEDPVVVLDYNSLYPSNMIAFNLSPDTLAYVKTYDNNGKKIRQEGKEINLDKYKVDEISYDIFDEDKNSCGRTVCGFVQPNDDANTIGILPLTLDILLKKRKETRKIMESIEDDAQKSVLNGLQLAYKVVANSVYGQCGSRTSPIRRLEVAACTTAVGRAKLNDAKKIVESEFGATVIYGDSVTGYTPVMIKQDDQIKIVNIEDLGTTWEKCQDSEKEYSELSNTFSWTEDGWTPIHRVIRHTLASHKKIMRILTHTGMVDVTDDHSLLKLDKTEISPKNLSVGDSLLHHAFPELESITTDSTLKYKAKIAGFFFGDGSCGIYDCPTGKKASWALNNANLDLLKGYVEVCGNAYPEFEWIINDTLLSSNVYKLVPKSSKHQSIKNFVLNYRSEMYVGQRKNIPDWVMNGSREIRMAFWEGMYDADGDKEKNYVRIDQKYQTTCAQIAFLGNLLGYNVSINDRSDKLKIARMTFTKKSYRKDPFKIKKIREIPYSGYVYDLTTSNHHFQAGIGQMIVHNTDSIFVQFQTKDLSVAIDHGKRAAIKINSLCRKAHKIEYEKTFFPFILFCRKRYMGLKYENDPTKCKRVSMGIALKRRDNAPIVKDIFGGALDILMEERSLINSQKFVQDMLVQVLQNKIPLEKFVITKQLRDDYKNPGQIAHRVLADRMEERDAGNAPQVGDRLAYIYVENKKNEKKQGDRIEHIDYVKSKGLKPDTEFYITNQIQNPVAQLFALGIEQLEGYVPKRYKEYPDLDEEEATLAVLRQKEQDLDSIMFMKANYILRAQGKPIQQRMDMFLSRK